VPQVQGVSPTVEVAAVSYSIPNHRRHEATNQ
jgi:hypothetical protein